MNNAFSWPMEMMNMYENGMVANGMGANGMGANGVGLVMPPMTVDRPLVLHPIIIEPTVVKAAPPGYPKIPPNMAAPQPMMIRTVGAPAMAVSVPNSYPKKRKYKKRTLKGKKQKRSNKKSRIKKNKF